MSEIGTPGDQAKPSGRRVYPPHEVQARLEVSASGLRRLAGIYERTVGALPRDDRGRVWPEDAVEALEDARALVREQRAISIEAALRGQEVETADTVDVLGSVDPGPASVPAGAGAAILEELRALRELVEEQNRRIAELEEAVRTGRELEPPRDESQEAVTLPEPPGGQSTPEPAPGGAHTGSSREFREGAAVEDRDTPARGAWRRLADWFGLNRP